MDWKELLVISAALKTGLLQSIAVKKQSADELADEHGYDLRAVEIVMEALREIGLVGRSRSHYELREPAKVYVDKTHPDYKAGSLLHSSRLIENWANLDEAIRTGKSQTRRRSENELESFAMAMDEFSRVKAPQVCSFIKKERPHGKTALDLGGALGTYSKELLKKGFEVTLLDTQGLTEMAKVHLKDTSVKILAGDFNERLPNEKFDVILLSNITHIYKPEKNEALLSRVEKHLSPGGMIAIVDLIRGKSKGAAMFGVNMLVHTAGGGTWTLPQYEKWLRHAGLKLISVKDLKNADQKLLLAQRISQ